LGEERWAHYRTIGNHEENYIPLNTMLSLNKRIGVLFQPSSLPQIVFTNYVATERAHVFDKQHYLKANTASEREDCQSGLQ
jgi:hypothetical protein